MLSIVALGHNKTTESLKWTAILFHKMEVLFLRKLRIFDTQIHYANTLAQCLVVDALRSSNCFLNKT